jgi:4-aminobutyrate aminotransferase-like enzyme
VSLCGPDSSAVRLSPPLILDDGHVERFLLACGESLRAL